jgi:hypothetical protein
LKRQVRPKRVVQCGQKVGHAGSPLTSGLANPLHCNQS